MPRERSFIDLFWRPVEKLARRRSPKARRWRSPVGWLLDHQLIASLKGIVLYTAFGKRIDPRNWMAAAEIDLTDRATDHEFWFDYMSDTGDGTRATYSVAYLAYSNLWIPQAGAEPGCRVKLDEDAEHSRRLPRGNFLFVGGDTAYHVADYETLAERFQQPFKWAYEDLWRRDKISAERRPLFGIPGNHDYYDFLDGFNRQFRRPFNQEQAFDNDMKGPQPLLVVPGFERLQETSYVALALPFGWRMWGIDAESGEMDRRQMQFFQQIRQTKPTDKLIVATPEPVTVFGRYRRARHHQAETFENLGLEQPFLRGQGETLPAGKARLDIAGDVHHYARYWGTTPGATTEEGHRANYASVVSGLGGAFLHSSSTDVGEVRAKVRYPEPQTALAVSVRRLTNVWNILRGGRVWMVGALVASTIFLGGLVSDSSRKDLVELFQRLGHTVGDVEPGVLDAAHRSLTVPRLSDKSSTGATQSADKPGTWLLWELSYLPLLLGAVLLGVFTHRRLKARSQSRRGEKSIHAWYYRWPIAVAMGVACVTVAFVYFVPGISSYGALKPLASNFVMLLLLAASFGGFYWSRQYDEAMFRQARLRRLNGWDQAFFIALFAFALLTGAFGLLRYGVDSLAVVAIDLLFILGTLGMLLGLSFFAAFTGAALYSRWGKAGFFLLGFWHGTLQLLLPLVLVVTRPWWQGLAAALAAAALTFAAGELVSRTALRDRDARDRFRVGALLLIIWILLGVGLAAFAFTGKETQSVDGLAFFMAAILGLLFSCIWFSWYLAVSLCFDGHNNEAGGGARIVQFKQFIRFRLTEESLTGFVIGIDDPEEDGSQLKPRLIDVFEVRPG
jgi:hypothetical protein